MSYIDIINSALGVQKEIDIWLCVIKGCFYFIVVCGKVIMSNVPICVEQIYENMVPGDGDITYHIVFRILDADSIIPLKLCLILGWSLCWDLQSVST
jgi:hypothetical protein